jgi:hypothetical protein
MSPPPVIDAGVITPTKNPGDDVELDLNAARSAFDAIGDDSVYKTDAKEAFLPAESQLVDDYEERAKSAANEKDCKQVRKIVTEARKLGVEAKAKAVKCTEPEASTKPGGNNVATMRTMPPPPPTTPPPSCNAQALQAEGVKQLDTDPNAALATFETAYGCNPTLQLAGLAFLAACRSKNAEKAKFYVNRAPRLSKQPCVANGTFP